MLVARNFIPTAEDQAEYQKERKLIDIRKRRIMADAKRMGFKPDAAPNFAK